MPARLKHVGLYLFSLFFIIAVILSVVAIYWLSNPGPNKDPGIILIQSGDNVPKIAGRLYDKNIIQDPLAFRVMARVTGLHRDLQAGEYEFPARANLALILTYLADGQTKKRFLTIPEGLTSHEIVKLITDAPALDGPIPDPPAEGTALPDTYSYEYGMERNKMLNRMQTAFNRFLDRAWANRADNLPINDKREAVILASIIEKETGVMGERAKVAGVFINRLNKGMRLQSDPTVIYALTKGEKPLGRPLYRSDWTDDSPYNTYQHDGLPPGPICHPGRATITTALNPADHDYLYFVAAPGGGHVFATNLADHNKNVAAWRRHKKQAAGSDG
jgi:UPF0755 protein